MTYLERITYLIGENDALISYCTFHAVHFRICYKTTKESNIKGAEKEAADRALAEEELKRFSSLSLDEKIHYFDDAGLSSKAYKQLKEGLTFSETVRTTYFKDHGKDFALEDPKIYEEEVRILEARNSQLSELNVYLVKSTDRMLRDYYK